MRCNTEPSQVSHLYQVVAVVKVLHCVGSWPEGGGGGGGGAEHPMMSQASFSEKRFCICSPMISALLVDVGDCVSGYKFVLIVHCVDVDAVQFRASSFSLSCSSFSSFSICSRMVFRVSMIGALSLSTFHMDLTCCLLGGSGAGDTGSNFKDLK